MPRKIVIAALTFVAYILQGTLMKGIAINNVAPNLILITVCICGFMNGRKVGMLVGFFCGLMTDIFFGNFIGLYSLLFIYIGYANGYFHKIFFPEDIKMPLILIAVSDFVYGIVVYLITYLLRGRFDFFFYLVHIILPEVFYTVLLTVIIYPLILKLDSVLKKYENRRAHDVSKL